jgi:hypothetical protein
LRHQEKIAVLIGDVALPLIGFFFWDWGFYFIALYFLIDQFAKQVFLLPRLVSAQVILPLKAIIFAKSILLFLFQILLILLINYQLNPQFNLFQESINFIMYKDMGIQQGFILVPLLFAAEWLKLKTDNKVLKSSEIKRLKINHVLKQAQILLSILGLLLGIINFTLIPELLAVFIFLIGIGLTAFVPVAKKNKEM